MLGSSAFSRSRNTVQRPRVSPMFRKRAGRCCPLADAPTSNRRRSKLGTINNRVRTFRFVNPPRPTPNVGGGKRLYFSVGGDADRDPASRLWPLFRGVAKSRRHVSVTLVVSTSFLIASPPRGLELLLKIVTHNERLGFWIQDEIIGLIVIFIGNLMHKLN